MEGLPEWLAYILNLRTALGLLIGSAVGMLGTLIFGRNYKARIASLEQKPSESGGVNITFSPNIYVQPTTPIADQTTEEPDGESDENSS